MSQKTGSAHDGESCQKRRCITKSSRDAIKKLTSHRIVAGLSGHVRRGEKERAHRSRNGRTQYSVEEVRTASCWLHTLYYLFLSIV
eukprot:6198804-Pleurochrysis_carterae.AAC.2